jgi:sporulation protein YlmC with PRC-barrel domain
MQRTIRNLIGNNLDATDGEIGEVEDFYFDDETWTIRYLVVKTGNWLSGRKVLISPDAMLQFSWGSGIFPVALTMEQVRKSPDIDTEKPVSRQEEEKLTNYYPWQPYWRTGFYPGSLWGVIQSTPVLNPASIGEPATIRRSKEELHLRSCQKVTRYHIHALDGDIGHLNDFVLDDQTWQISYLIVDTHNWIGGKKVLVAVRHIKGVQWGNSKVAVDITVETIKNSSAVDTWDYIIPERDKAESKQHSFHLQDSPHKV